MTRHVRKTVIQAEIETTYGSNAGITWGGASAILISGSPRHRIVRDGVARDLVRQYFGGSEHLIGTRMAEIEFDVELAGSGTKGDAPPWGRLLRGCGMAEVITAGQFVSYTPITDAPESLSFRYFIDGVMYVSRGGRGTVQLDLTAYQRPMLKFKFQAFDTAANLASGLAANYADWVRPQVVSDANSGDIAIGGTYAAGWVTGGTILPSRGMTIDLGNQLSHIKLLGGESIDIVNRETTGKLQVALSAADEVAWRNSLNNNELVALSFRHGVGDGNRIAIHAPAVQRMTPEIEDYEGRHMVAPDLRFLPVSGNDELRIVAS